MEKDLERENEHLRSDISDLQAIARYSEKRNDELVQLLYEANKYIKEKRL